MKVLNLRKPFFLIALGALSYLFVDRPLTAAIAPYAKAYKPFYKMATLCIFPPLYLAVSGVGLLVSRLRKSPWTPHFFEVFVSQCLSVAFVRVFKILIGRARPDIFIKKGVYGFYGLEWDHHFHSFPSGHSMAAYVLATSLSLLFPRYRLPFFSVAALLTLSRIFILGHYLSDVIGTAAIALLIGSGVHQIIQTITRKNSHETVRLPH